MCVGSLPTAGFLVLNLKPSTGSYGRAKSPTSSSIFRFLSQRRDLIIKFVINERALDEEMYEKF